MEDKKANEPEVELNESTETKPGAAQLPVNFTAVGTIENDDVRIYIKQSAYKEIEKLAQSDKTKELGSFLIGCASEEMGKTHVVISDIIEAKYTDASVSTLTFTHETWNYVHGEQEKLYPEKSIVGWQHTHPDYGIFLSNYDMFIHENFFNLPFQIAYVVDPIQNTRAFFQWKNGKVQKIDGFYVYDEIGKTIKVEQPKKKEQEPIKSSKFKKFIIAAVCLLLAMSAALAVAVILISSSQRDYIESSRKLQENLTDQIQQQQAQIDEQKNTIENLKTAQSDSDTDSDSLNTQIQQQQDLLKQQEDQLSSMNDLLDKVTAKANGQLIAFTKYVVKKGDSLSSICQQYGLNYVSNRKIILAMNGIRNEDLITVGETILLPIAGGAEQGN